MNSEKKISNRLTCKLSVRRWQLCIHRTGVWGFEDALALRYGFAFKEHTSKCDGCDQLFEVSHALTCQKEALVTRRHYEIRDFVADLSRLAWTSVTREPVFKQADGNEPGLKAGLLIRVVWNPEKTPSLEIRHSKSYRSRLFDAVLQSCEQKKKKKYGPACSERHIKEFQFFIKIRYLTRCHSISKNTKL